MSDTQAGTFPMSQSGSTNLLQDKRCATIRAQLCVDALSASIARYQARLVTATGDAINVLAGVIQRLDGLESLECAYGVFNSRDRCFFSLLSYPIIPLYIYHLYSLVPYFPGCTVALTVMDYSEDKVAFIANIANFPLLITA